MLNNSEDEVSKSLEKLLEIRLNRRNSYGDAATKKGEVMAALFNSMELKTESDFARFGILNFIVSKLIRYSENFENGGHADSLDDLAIYSLMLKEMDDKNNVGN